MTEKCLNQSLGRRLALGLLLMMLAVPAAPRAQASEGEQVVVAYNKRMKGSQEVAEHYARARGVPKDHIIALDVRPEETISREIFDNDIREPLARQIARRGLWKTGPLTIRDTNGAPVRTVTAVTESKIRYLVLCYGVPLRILPATNLTERVDPALRPEMRRNEAAVDSELAFLPLARRDLTLSGPAPNHAYGATNPAAFHPTNALLMVARLDGPTAEIARGLVDKALIAERDGLWGRAYFDLRGITNGPYAQGDRWIAAAAEIARLVGFDTVVEGTGALFPASTPMSHIALYAGWYAQNVTGPFMLNTVEFVPGALAYHLHSFSAPTLRSRTVGWAGPFLATGVTATLGTVWEPYLSGTPDVGVLFARLLVNGFTFGEAAYSSTVMLSWMTTVVGDPLYRPFGRDLREKFEDLRARNQPEAAWALVRLVNMNLARGMPLAEAIALLERAPDTNESSVLLERLGDLYAAQGKPSSAALMWQRALALPTSLQQSIRIELKLAEQLVKLDRRAEALEVYARFLRNYPDYQGRLLILRSAEALARGHDPSLAASYAGEIARLTAPPPGTNSPAEGP